MDFLLNRPWFSFFLVRTVSAIRSGGARFESWRTPVSATRLRNGYNTSASRRNERRVMPQDSVHRRLRCKYEKQRFRTRNLLTRTLLSCEQYVFCRRCLRGYHVGECDTQLPTASNSANGSGGYSVDPLKAKDVRCDTIFSTQKEKFTLNERLWMRNSVFVCKR